MKHLQHTTFEGGVLEDYFAGKVKALNELKNRIINDCNDAIDRPIKPISPEHLIAKRAEKAAEVKALKRLFSHITSKLETIYKYKTDESISEEITPSSANS